MGSGFLVVRRGGSGQGAGMVEIKDIVDRESLEGWLEGQPKEVSVWIARRAAMRVLPFYWEWTVTSKAAREGDLTALPFLRFYLISEVARKMPTSEITARAAAARAAAVWTSICADCKAIAEGDDLDGLELWAAGDNPLVGVWTQVKVKLLVHSSSRSEETARGSAQVDWSFWTKWYVSVLAGLLLRSGGILKRQNHILRKQGNGRIKLSRALSAGIRWQILWSGLETCLGAARRLHNSCEIRDGI